MTVLWLALFGAAWVSMARFTAAIVWLSPEKYDVQTNKHEWRPARAEYETRVWSFPMFGSFEKIEGFDDYVSCLYSSRSLAKLCLFIWPLVLVHALWRVAMRFTFRPRHSLASGANTMWNRIITTIEPPTPKKLEGPKK